MSQQIKRTVWILTGVIVLLVLASVYMVFPQLRGLSQRNMHIARITEDGEVLYEIDLDAVDEPYTANTTSSSSSPARSAYRSPTALPRSVLR